MARLVRRRGCTAPPHGLFLWDIRYGRAGMKRPPYGKIPAEAPATIRWPHEETADSEA